MINAGCGRVNIGFIYICSIDISSFTYIGLFSFVIPNTGIDKYVILSIIGQGGGGSMSMGGALEPYCLSISAGKMSSDNGLPHVSLEVGIEDTKHEGLFSLEKLFLFRFTAWSIVGIQHLIALEGLGNYE